MKRNISRIATILLASLLLAGCWKSQGNSEGIDVIVPGGGATSDKQADAVYIGLWHASPVVGSGFSERLALNSDHTFLWAASQMDGEERVRFSSGTWFAEDGKLKLEVNEEIRWEGGRVVPAYASWGTDTVIEDADIVISTQTVPAEFELSNVTTDPEVMNKKTVVIGGIRYWELLSSPELDELVADYEALKAQAVHTSSSPAPVINSGEPLYESQKVVLEMAFEALKLLKNNDWGAIGHLVHPKQGLTFSPYGYVDEDSAVCLGKGDVIPLWMDDTVRSWGNYDGSGEPIKMTIKEYYDRFIMSHDFTKAPEIGVDRIIRTTLENNLFVFGNGGSYVDFHMPGDAENPDYTWASLRLVFGWYEGDENVESGLYLVAIVHDEWTI